jgi:short-subunit dehydrogenase
MQSKTVVITGASSGIGKALVYEFVSKGSKVVMAARRVELLQQIEKELGSENVLAVKADVSKEDDCRRLIESAVGKFGSIDVLINNAGISMRAILEECEVDVLRRVMDVNFWGTVYCTKYALPYLLKAQGSVVGVVSIAGYIGLPGRTAYSASKFAIRGFLDTLRVENRKKNLHVLIAAPGFVASEIREHALVKDGSEQKTSPKPEEDLMTAERCAYHIYRAVKKRKRVLILSFYTGVLAVFFSKWWPQLVDRANFNLMSKEPDSPF